MFQLSEGTEVFKTTSNSLSSPAYWWLVGTYHMPSPTHVQHMCQLDFDCYMLHNPYFIFQPSLLHGRYAIIVICTPRTTEDTTWRLVEVRGSVFGGNHARWQLSDLHLLSSQLNSARQYELAGPKHLESSPSCSHWGLCTLSSSSFFCAMASSSRESLHILSP